MTRVSSTAESGAPQEVPRVPTAHARSPSPAGLPLREGAGLSPLTFSSASRDDARLSHRLNPRSLGCPAAATRHRTALEARTRTVSSVMTRRATLCQCTVVPRRAQAESCSGV